MLIYKFLLSIEEKAMKRRALVLGCLVLAVFQVMAGGQKGAQEGTTQGAKPHVVVTYFSYSVQQEKSSLGTVLGDLINEKFNVEFRQLPFSGSRDEKALMMLAAQDFGGVDLVETANAAVTGQYIGSGQLVNLDDYRAKLQDFYEFQKGVIPYWRTYDAANGGLYVWETGPNDAGLASGMTYCDMYIRTDVLEKAGYPNLDTTDDYIAMLKDVIKKIPNATNGQPSIPVASYFGRAIRGPQAILTPIANSGYTLPSVLSLVDPGKGKFEVSITHPVTKEVFQFWNTLWREGLLDKEVFTTDSNKMMEKMNAGIPLMAGNSDWGAPVKDNSPADARGDTDKHWIYIPMRLNSAKNQGKPRYVAADKLHPFTTGGILKSSKYAERIIEVLNFISNNDIVILGGWGREGKDYTVQNGKMVFTREFLDITQKEFVNEINNLGERLPLRTYAMLNEQQTAYYRLDPSLVQVGATPAQLKAYQGMGWADWTSGMKASRNFKTVFMDSTNYSAASILPPDSEEATIAARVTDYYNQQCAQVVTAATEAEFERQFKILSDTMISYGNAKVVDRYNSQLAALDAKLKELSAK
jgi:ABC-type glycerol-3-phosphate transport system substrate-binding protein